MSTSTFDEKAEFREGLRHSLPFILSVYPFGIVVATLGVNNGGSAFDVMLQSALFFAGASQTVMWELYGAGTPLWVIPLAIFAVNFRLVLYSAAIGRKLEPLSKPKMASALFLLQDVAMAVGMKRAESSRGLSFGHYMGINLALYAVWLLGSATGVVFGQLIDDPKSVGLDMLVPVYFLLLLMGFRSKPNMLIVFVVSASVSALVYWLIGSPYHIAAGGLSGMLVAALVAKPESKHV